MTRVKTISRRTFLKSSSATIALPFLEAMIPSYAKAQAVSPKRLATFYFPYGVHQRAWRPLNTGALGNLPQNLAALNPIKNRINLTGGLGSWGIPQGSHMIGIPRFMGNDVVGFDGDCQAYSNRNQKSADILISEHIARTMPTHQPLISRNGSTPYLNGYCDKHTGPFYRHSSNLSFTSFSTPASQLTAPQAVFDRLFAGISVPTADPMIAYRRTRGLSVLDSVLGQSQTLMNRLGASDKILMDQYLTSLREVERTLASVPPPPVNVCTLGTRPAANLSFEAETKAFIDLAVLAMACDQTRVVSHIFDVEDGAGHQQMPHIGLAEPGKGHHDYSHWNFPGNEALSNEYAGKYLRITEWYGQMLAYLLNKMISYKEGDRDLLYNSVVVFGSGMGDVSGQEHDQVNIPMVLAGELGGLIRTGQGHNLDQVRTANVWLTLMQKFGIQSQSYSFSNGVINL